MVPEGVDEPVPGADPPVRVGGDDVPRALLEATRALLWLEGPDEASRLAADLVHALGGDLVPARQAGPEALPVDVSFGAEEPMLPTAPRGAVRRRLERHLPGFVRDAHRAIELADRAIRLAEEAWLDPLTGVANRRLLGRRLGRLRPEDTVVVIDLDHFKEVNDTLGHEAGDEVLRALGGALTASARATDTVGRYGGEEFVVVLTGQAEPFLRRFQAEWQARRPRPVTFSAGVAPGAPRTRAALQAADRALYRAKESGRDRWTWAVPEDYA